jgi:hypothetical protein
LVPLRGRREPQQTLIRKQGRLGERKRPRLARRRGN